MTKNKNGLFVLASDSSMKILQYHLEKYDRFTIRANQFEKLAQVPDMKYDT